MEKQDLIKYFINKVDEVELDAYICEAIFDLNELEGLSEDEIIDKYKLDMYGAKSIRYSRNTLFAMLKDIDKHDKNIFMKSYYNTYFK